LILYLDASALVKRYVHEAGSPETEAFIEVAATVVTSVVSRTEVEAALAKAVRLKAITGRVGQTSRQRFAEDWVDLVRLPVSEGLTIRAGELAWRFALRGYDALHLASALGAREMTGSDVTLATFDRQLWQAGREAGLAVWPPLNA